MSGYVQLLACGQEKEIFNENPQISYFRNAYYRYTNFYIANQETLNNNIKGKPNITFNISKDGDFLGKSYIKFAMPDNFTELFYEYANVNMTLLINILNFYDCFTIRTNKYAKSDINKIKLFKMQINNYFTIFSSYFNSQDLLTLIFENSNVGLSTDANQYYYNINIAYLYYAFDYYQSPFINITLNPIVSYLFSAIQFSKINYIRIDIPRILQVSIKITFPDPESYHVLSLIILNSADENDNIRFKIDKQELYFYLDFANDSKQNNAFEIITEFSINNAIPPKTSPTVKSPTTTTPNNVLYNRLRNTMLINKSKFLSNQQLEKLNSFIEERAYKITIINNKIASSTFFSTDIKQIFSYVTEDTANYLNINVCTDIPSITLYRFSGGNYFFGNYDNIDFNSALIADESVAINNNAFSSNTTISMNVFLKLFTTYYCLNVPPTIQNYLKFVNNNNTQMVAKYYSNNVTAFNNLTIQVLFNPNILVLNYDNLQSILYQKEIKDLYSTSESTTNLIIPYINRRPFLNSEIILNRYIYDGFVQNINTLVASAFDLTENIVNLLILLNLNNNKNNITLYGNLLYNYNINNFVFDSADSTEVNLLSSNAILNTNIVTLLYYYNFVDIVMQSMNTISNIYNSPSYCIYDNMGKHTEIVSATLQIGSIFPMSSNLFNYKNANETSTTFNISIQTYLIKMLDLINSQIIVAFDLYKINYNGTITLPLINSFTSAITNDYYKLVANYYDNLEIDVTSIDFDIVNSFLNSIVATNFNSIYNIDLIGFNLSYFTLNAMFDYIDLRIFNNAFANNLSVTTSSHYGVKFLYEINSPLYRLYYLFSFLAFMSLDSTLINTMPFDLITLRDLTINFILQVLHNFNDLIYSPLVFSKYNMFKFDLTPTHSNQIFIANNVLCYDNISSIENVLYDENEIYIYNAFFFVKNTIDLAIPEATNIPSSNQIDYTNWQNALYKNIYNTIKTNYDDNVINIFIATIILNKKYFKNVEQIIILVKLFFEKDNLDYNAIIAELSLIINSYNQYNNYGNLTYAPIVFATNPLYYNCYYTTFSIGAMFDNTVKLMTNTINSTYNTVTETLNNINGNYFTELESNIKQYQNIIVPNNTFDLFSYVKTIFYNIGIGVGFNVEFYYNNLITEFNKYLLSRLSYINKYVAKQYVFEECLSIMDKYVLLFNNKNKINANIYAFYGDADKTFISPRLIVVYLLYLSFLQQCLSYDVSIFISTSSNVTMNFELFLLNKYTYNIYIQCLNELIATLETDVNVILLDYSTINIFTSLSFASPNTNKISEYRTYFNNIVTDDGFQGNNRVLINYFNIWNQPTYSQNNVIYPFVENDIVLFQTIQNNVDSLLSQTNKLLFTIYNNNNLSIVSFSVNDIVNNSFQKTYELYKNEFYINSQILLASIYKELNDSLNFDTIVSPFSRRIVNYSMNVLRNYFNDDGVNGNNYYKAIYYEQYDAGIGSATTDLCVFTTTYLNNIITKSLKIEGALNRIIYYYLTQYAVSIAGMLPTDEFIKTHSLYDYVRMFNPIYKNASSITYETNLALIQNEQVFGLLNFDNFAENISFSQNAWFNDLLLMVGTDLSLPYGEFYNFIVAQNNPTFQNFTLIGGTNVFEYFTLSPVELDELNILFYDFVVSNQYFSPYHIYNEIIKFKQTTNNITAQYTMEFDNIKKKIVVYLFVMAMIYKNIPNMINVDNLLGIKADYYLEYSFPNNTIVFKISDAILNLNTDFIINIKDIVTEYLQKMFNDVIPSGAYPAIIQNAFAELTDISTEYVSFASAFVSSYELYVGNENIFTSSLLANTFEQIFNVSSNVKNINIILNNDIDATNPNNYAVTTHVYNKMDMFYEQQLFSLNQPNLNNVNINTEFSVTKHMIFNKTDIETFNLIYNAIVTYVGYYGIQNNETTAQIDSVINYLSYFAKSSVNEVLELLKGVATNNLISLDFIDDGTNPLNLNINMFSRAQNIKNLSVLSTLPSNDYSMSIIAPNDYDFNTNNITFYQIYNNRHQINIYKKYYNFTYNFYNFPDNFIVIYDAKYKYYQNILANSNTINNVKSNNLPIYLRLMNDIYFTLTANGFYQNLPIIDSSILFIAMNACVTVYLKYNFAFRLNSNLTNIENMRLQAELQYTNNILTLDNLAFYVKKLYYYEIFSANIRDFNEKTVQGDYVNFMAQLTIINNYNFIYQDQIINFVYRFELIIVTLFLFIQQKFGITISYDTAILKQLMQLYVFEIANVRRINTFINTIFVNYENNDAYKKINNMTATSYANFIQKFKQAIGTIVYYTDNFSITYILTYVYNALFKDVVFNYHDYAGDNYKMYDYTLPKNIFIEIVYDYMFYYTNNINKGNAGYLFKEMFDNFIYNNVIAIKNNKYIDFAGLLSLLNDYFDTEYITFQAFFYNIATNILTNNYWGLVYNSNTVSFNNNLLTFQIFYLNLYFATLNDSTYFLQNVIEQNVKLEQLYRINILLLTAMNTANPTYSAIMKQSLTNAHTIIFNGILTNTINEIIDVCVFFDYLNKNIIPTNKIQNYYKNVQNETIKNVLFYKILSFGNNDVINNYLIDVYNEITTHLITYNETNLGLLYFNNTIVATLNNYKLDAIFDNIVINNENVSYVNTIIRNVFVETYQKLDVYKNIFGTNDPLINSMFINTNLIFNIFNKQQYVFNDRFITIMTFIYANYANTIEMFNYDITIILFYYNCLITFLLRYGENYDLLNNLMYFLVNLINNNIIDFVNGVNAHDEFFNGLTDLMFDEENNVVEVFVDNCYTFFNTLIHNLFWTTYSKNYLQTSLIQRDNLRAFSSQSKISASTEWLNNKVTNSLIYNAKINVWKNMLSVIIDYNQSNYNKNMKSVMYDGCNIINVQQEYVEYVSAINSGLINHYGILQMISDVRLLFGDQIIDRVTDDIYKIILELFTNVNKLPALNEMLGIEGNNILDGLKPYIKKYQSRVFYLPLNFFFEKILNAVPLIACIHLNVNIDLYMKYNTLIKSTINVNDLMNLGDFQTSLYSNYYLVERDERKIIASNAMNNLIEKHNSYSLSKNVLFTNDELVFVQFDFEMTNMVKELIWFYDFSLNNYKIAHAKFGESDIYDYLVNVVFYMDGMHRDGMEILNRTNRNQAITEYINKYKYCTRASPDNIYNNYSFALKPEEFQPSGAINMSRFSVFRIELVFDSKGLLEYLGKFNKITNFNNLSLTVHLQTLEYNEMIYRSGLAGLGFVS